jgi:hypothetical protein
LGVTSGSAQQLSPFSLYGTVSPPDGWTFIGAQRASRTGLARSAFRAVPRSRLGRRWSWRAVGVCCWRMSRIRRFQRTSGPLAEARRSDAAGSCCG